MVRIVWRGFHPIPAMSMVSYAAGTRYLSLLGGTCLSFYDWYCDSSTRVANDLGASRLTCRSPPTGITQPTLLPGALTCRRRVPRTPTSLPKCATKAPRRSPSPPDYSEVAKLCDQWLAPKQGTDSALAMAMGHVILKEFHLDNPSDYFLNYCRRYTDMPMLVLLDERADGSYVPGRMMRASDLVGWTGRSQ
ncbi:respiratory nitrate reductase 2 subunit alpha [Salmonella enterica subsp. enterica serovar Daytona]|uniref:Respiratory nitrate reductase 2 subunit alpha n=1 Tax=Salmonella enterica subsp. enterica serovar Daytona TaxID=1962639 RepID=A0A447JIG0_SALET|nr:respiratory nitrate reductase 2 subunit alpha [Salmonella enterica subsp. enterica serovar Daytona]